MTPFESLDGDLGNGLLLICDHARNTIPPDYDNLGLPHSELDRHIAYDPGAEAMTRALAARLGAPALFAGFSRLLIDPNRGVDDPTLIRQVYDGTVVPGNHPLSDAERARRIDRFYRPYHDAIAARLEAVASAAGRAPMIVSIHSFTARMKGRDRPWQIGVLWDLDDRVARPLLAALHEDASLVIGENEPYEGALRGDTLYRHAILNGYAHVLIEFRQDQLAEAAGIETWSSRLAPILEGINANPDVAKAAFFGSKTGPLQRQD